MSDLEYTPELEDIIRLAIEQRLFDLNVSLPGVVESFDASKQTASIQPALQRKYGDTAVSLPVLQNVPVVFMKAGAWHISGPLKKGDTGHLIFVQRSLDIWKKQGGVVDPKDPRKFHITDAVFYPGLAPTGKVISTIDAAHFRIQSGDARIELQDGGKFRIEKVGGDELIDLLIQITAKLSHVADKLSTTTTNTQLGPQPLLDAGDFGATKGQIDALKAKLQALKG